MTPITVLLVDDHCAVRESYRLLLEQFNIAVIGESNNAEQALIDYPKLMPDVVIMDLSLKGMNGLECTALLIQRYPSAKIVVFSMHDNTNFARRAMQNGAMAYVLKSDPSAILVESIKQVYYQSKCYLSPNIAASLASNIIHKQHDRLATLTDREYAVFLLLVDGKSRQEIAETLSLSAGTISNNKVKIMQKLNVKTMVNLVAIAVEYGIIKQNQLDI